MPRTSSAAKAVNVSGSPDALRPRKGLAAPLKSLFEEIVSEVKTNHFVASDRVLLERYCEAIRLAELAQRHIDDEGPVTDEGRVSPWITVQEKAHRSAVALAGKLRLCPQSRLDRKTAGATTSTRKRAQPWED
jgi:phage terminase small subunit